MKNINILLFLILLITVSCSKIGKNQTDLSQQFGKRIELIDTLPVYFNNNLQKVKDINVDKMKVVSYIDGSCFSCSQDLIKWNEIMNKFIDKDVKVLVYLHLPDFKTFRPYIDRWRIKYPIIIDKDNIFFTINKISDDKVLQTMLLNKSNEMILLGNPLENKDFFDLYLSTINKMK